MPELIAQLAKTIDARLRSIGDERPPLVVLKALLEIAYHATLRTEEGRFIRGSFTYTSRRMRPEDGPATKRADYPNLWPLRKRVPLTVERVVKLSRAIDMWSGSLAIYGTTADDLHIWGVVDQLAQANVRLHRESDGGFNNPGLFAITMEGVGDLSVYHQSIFLGGLRGHQLLAHEDDPLRSDMVWDHILPHLDRPGQAISRVLDAAAEQESLTIDLFNSWLNTVSRLCIALRRFGTGGTLVITPSPHWDQLDIGHEFDYERLGNSMVLNVLDERYRRKSEDNLHSDEYPEFVPYDAVLEALWAEADAKDRQSELAGAVKLVASLASVDGAVFLSPLLHVYGFGVKIGAGPKVGTVYDGADFSLRGVRASKIDPKRFGTRHNSVLRYCRLDKEAVGVVVSQDGHVRLILSAARSLVLWDNVKLLGYRPFTHQEVKAVRYWRENHTRSKQPKLGYTDTPKTLAALLRVLDD